MFRFKSLFRFLAVWLGVIAILSISSASAFAAEKPEIFVQLGHSDNVNSVAFSPDGKYLASGNMDKSVKIWDVDTGREIRTFRLEQLIVWHSSESCVNEKRERWR